MYAPPLLLQAVNYVRRNKKQLLIAQRHGGMGRKAQDKLSGQITELAGEVQIRTQTD